MEVLSFHSANYVTNSRDLKDLNSYHFDLHSAVGRHMFPRNSSALGYIHRGCARSKRVKKHKFGPPACSLSSYDPSVASETYSPYTLDGEVKGSIDITGAHSTAPKVLIPALPDEESGDDVAPITSCYWQWKPKLAVYYETAGSHNKHSPPVLFLPGFGVGSFHYEKQLKDLGRRYRAWALDFLGQGMSLPHEDPTSQKSKDGTAEFWGFGDESEAWAEELVFSVDLWQEQVRCFVEEVIREPTYVVGNSLGGFVALYVAASNPELVKGVTLLNATPFWGFLPNPERSPRLARLFPWSGTFPLPSNIRKLVEILWQKISDPKSISEILEQVYADHSTDVDKVFARIVETTRHPAAAASFASIMFAPQGRLTFNETLSRCRENNTNVCLVYGKEDPWVTPIWGLQAKRQLPNAPYYEISPAGHCPHDEVAEVVNFLLHGWMQNLESNGTVSLPLLEETGEDADFGVVTKLEFCRKGGNAKKSVEVRFHGAKESLWRWVKSHFNPFGKLRFQPLVNETSV